MEAIRRELLLDTQTALKIGTTVEQYRTQREQRIEKWTKLFHQEMEKWGADDPLQVLPAVLAKVEEAAHATALVAARAVAKKEAAAMIKSMLRKAIT